MAHIVQMVPILNLMRLGCNSSNFNIVGFDCERDLEEPHIIFTEPHGYLTLYREIPSLHIKETPN